MVYLKSRLTQPISFPDWHELIGQRAKKRRRPIRKTRLFRLLGCCIFVLAPKRSETCYQSAHPFLINVQKPFYSLAGLLYKDKVARVALTCDSLVEEQNTYSHKRRKPSRKTRLSDKWRMAGAPSSGLRATRTLLIEGRTQSFKCKKALLFLAGLLYKWRSGRDSNPRPPA